MLSLTFLGLDSRYPQRNPDEVIDLLEACKRTHNATQLTKSLVLTTFVKLSHRFEGAGLPRILQFLDTFKESMDMELQQVGSHAAHCAVVRVVVTRMALCLQRACEFTSLLEASWDNMRGIALESMPKMDEEKLRAKRARQNGYVGSGSFSPSK